MDVVKGNPPRMANLINGLGKCAAISDDVGQNGQHIIQWDCNQYEKGMLWSWNETALGSGNRHLCNGHGKCVGSPVNSPNSNVYIYLIQWDHFDEEGQRYRLLDSPARPGFYSIKNDHGKCISVSEGTCNVFLYTKDCNSSEDDQLWKWRRNL